MLLPELASESIWISGTLLARDGAVVASEVVESALPCQFLTLILIGLPIGDLPGFDGGGASGAPRRFIFPIIGRGRAMRLSNMTFSPGSLATYLA